MMSNFIYGQKISKIQNVTVSPDLREFKKSSVKLYSMLSLWKISKIQNVTVSPDLREFKKSSVKLYLMLSAMLLMASTLVCFAKFYV